jgi:GNAT superfamily N-acetyltransferase
MIYEKQHGEYLISTDKSRLDIEAIQGFLNKTYWAAGRPVETVLRSIKHSLTFGLYRGDTQLGLSRVVTDYATFAWLGDVFIGESVRGQGLGKWLVETIISHPEWQGFRRWVLATKDAHELYRKFGFTELKRAERWMELADAHAPGIT